MLRLLTALGVAAALDAAPAPHLAGDLADLAAPLHNGTRLHSTPPIWLTERFLSAEAVARVRTALPLVKEEEWFPCVNQQHEFASKRCYFLPVAGDAILEGAVRKVATPPTPCPPALARPAAPRRPHTRTPAPPIRWAPSSRSTSALCSRAASRSSATCPAPRPSTRTATRGALV